MSNQTSLLTNWLIRRTANTDRQVPTQIGAKARVVQTNALLDSGSLAGDFINAETLRTLGGVVLYCTYSTYVPYSLSPYRVLNSDIASALALLSRHIVISPLSS